MLLCATTPVGANGDSVPAKAPLPAMIAISSGGTPARAATAIAGGASSALAGVAPAPIVAMTKPITKNIRRNAPACPRHRRTARSVSRASVPLTSAMENSSVTPSRVTKRSVGKPSSTLAGLMPASPTPTTSASASDSTPTLIVVVQESVIAKTSAATETHARLILVRLTLLGRRRQRAHQRRHVGELLEPVDELEHLVDALFRQHERRAVAPLLVELVARERQVGSAAITLVGMFDELAAVDEVDLDR